MSNSSVMPPALDQGVALFLDFDGTLSPLQDDPDAVFLASGLDSVLMRVSQKLDGALAILSGRDLTDLSKRVPDTLFGMRLLKIRTASAVELGCPHRHDVLRRPEDSESSCADAATDLRAPLPAPMPRRTTRRPALVRWPGFPKRPESVARCAAVLGFPKLPRVQSAAGPPQTKRPVPATPRHTQSASPARADWGNGRDESLTPHRLKCAAVPIHHTDLNVAAVALQIDRLLIAWWFTLPMLLTLFVILRTMRTERKPTGYRRSSK